MHYVIHVIPVKPGSIDKAKEIFDKEVPPLAAGFDAWRGARLTATDDDQLVTMGIWADKDQMMQFLAQPAFAEAMGAFSEIFAGPPSKFITEQVTAVGPAAE